MPLQCIISMPLNLGQQLKRPPQHGAFRIRHPGEVCPFCAQPFGAVLSSSICSSLAFTPSPPPP